MEQVRKQREPAERMEVIDILEFATKNKKQAIGLYNALTDLVTNDPDFRVMRTNNTLFAYNNNRDGTVDISMESADSPDVFPNTIKEFFDAMKKCGFKSGKFEIDKPELINAAKMAGRNINMAPSGGLMPDGVTPSMIGTVEF